MISAAYASGFGPEKKVQTFSDTLARAHIGGAVLLIDKERDLSESADLSRRH